jgi:hypothetical protein
MKRELFAISMIALLVLTFVGTAAVTAKPADAKLQGCDGACAYKIALWWPSKWTGSCYNIHGTQIIEKAPGLTETSQGSTLTTKDIQFEMSGARGSNVANLGVDWSLKPWINWNVVKNRPVKVTALVSYTLSGNGNAASSSTVALRGGDPITSPNYKTIAWAGTNKIDKFPQQPYSDSASQKQVTWITTLDKLSTGKGVGTVTVGLWTSFAPATGYQNGASGQVTVSAIQLILL